ncbi:MAG: hypothetical protein ACJ75J_14560, partial [Cytophagaceae bacterium]
MSAKKTQVLLISGALILFVLLFIAPKTEPKANEEASHSHSEQAIKADNNASISVYLNTAIKNLEPSQKTAIEKLMAG